MLAMRILVTGSRDLTDRKRVLAGLTAAVHEWEDGVPTLVHGAARGADAIARSIAEDLGWLIEAHRVTDAEWRRRGRHAGPLRNQRMVDSGADICVAFPLPNSRGTWDCVRRAEAAGIPVLES